MKKKQALVFYSHLKLRDIELDLVKFIKYKKKYITIFVVNTKETELFYKQKFPNCVDKFFVYLNEYELLQSKIKRKAIVKKALEIEKKLGMTINRAFLENRVIARGYHSSGGFNHPKIRLAENSHEDILKIAVGHIEFWENIFKKYNIKVAINLPPIGMRVSKLNKVMTKKLSISKFDKRLYWTSNVNNEPENLINYFIKNKKKKFNKFIADKPQFNHLELRPSDIKGFQFFNTLKVSVITYLKRIYGSYKGYRKGKNMYALSEFAYIWRKRKDYLWLRKNANLTSKDLIRKKIKYIYFPLTAEPETAMHGLAEDFFFQLTAINMLSRDLPADYKILVKEHLFAIGRRPNNFYNQIRELKNVLMVDPLEYGINFLKNASAVSVVVGTSGWEAAAMGIPVISFTKHNSYNFLDHVFTVKEPDDTKGILQQIKLKKYPSKKSIQDGAKMHDSYIDLSFKFDKNTIFQNWDQEKNTKPSKDFIKKIYDNLYLKN